MTLRTIPTPSSAHAIQPAVGETRPAPPKRYRPRLRFRGVGMAAVGAGLALFLGLSSTAATAAPTPNSGPTAGGTGITLEAPGGITFTRASAGAWYSLAVASNGDTYAWGANTYGQLGTGNNDASVTPTRVQAPEGVTFTQVSGGEYHSLALGSDGNAYAWGANWNGELGINSANGGSNVPQRVHAPSGVTFTQVEAGSANSLALGSDGNIYMWGNGTNGILGNGTEEGSTVPVRVHAPEGVSFTRASLSSFRALAMGSDGNTYAWGYGVDGLMSSFLFLVVSLLESDQFSPILF
ncbi:hypothetical protein CRE_07123 [Caenorhabditis remanei]|uniref:Uncharacterized protein n=1 Tax=Caenorhabditis remanei TaxID=31234 RepID=E3NPA8_CAERE|nr:hypothetical protein CRE_07123 [Caenorhabditis remanei]